MNDCVSLEIAKKLKEVGYSVETQYAYVIIPDEEGGKVQLSHLAYCVFWNRHNGWTYFLVPTIGELLEAIDVVEMRLYALQKPVSAGGGKEYLAYPIGDEDITGRSENPADALALLWMALKEKNLV